MKTTIITCDRCGAEIKNRNENELFIIKLSKNPFHSGTEHTSHDLCRKCAISYISWIEG